MKRLFDSADEYLRRSTWRGLAVLKFCLIALGVLVGLSVPRQRRGGARLFASVVFAVTCVPLMARFLCIFARRRAADA